MRKEKKKGGNSIGIITMGKERQEKQETAESQPVLNDSWQAPDTAEGRVRPTRVPEIHVVHHHPRPPPDPHHHCSDNQDHNNKNGNNDPDNPNTQYHCKTFSNDYSL